MKSLFKIITFALLSYLLAPSPAHAIITFESSGTCTSFVGNPAIPTGTQAGCNTTGSGGGVGDFAFPLDPNKVTAIASEMSAYAGNYSYGGHREHAGLDIGSPISARIPVYAVADGTINSARDTCYIQSEGWQCRLDIYHDGTRFISSYSHIDAIPAMRPGTKVKRGQQIGVVHFWTQYSNMDHLHFELMDKNVLDSYGSPININPRNYFPELQRWGSFAGSGAGVRSHTNSAGLFWVDDGKEYAETYRNHPPCGYAGCWAH